MLREAALAKRANPQTTADKSPLQKPAQPPTPAQKSPVQKPSVVQKSPLQKPSSSSSSSSSSSASSASLIQKSTTTSTPAALPSLSLPSADSKHSDTKSDAKDSSPPSIPPPPEDADEDTLAAYEAHLRRVEMWKEDQERAMQKKQAEEEEGEEEEDEEEEAGGGGEEKDAQGRIQLAPSRKGTRMELSEMQFVASLCLMRSLIIRLQLSCTRCRLTTDCELTGRKLWRKQCANCHLEIAAFLRPEMVHERNPSLGYVDVDGCHVADLLPCDFMGNCLTCFRDSPFDGVQRGQMYERNCRGCHAKLGFRFESVDFDVITPPGGLIERAPKEAKGSAQTGPRNVQKKQRDPRIKAGQPLPEGGACDHYRKSFRWLRFPCCGKAFPCDTCHDDASDHCAEWASRQICGNCAKEQPYGPKSCVSCGWKFQGGGSSHWEGGKGCRDKNKMSRNDPKKYKGLNKTVSMKSARVGKKIDD